MAKKTTGKKQPVKKKEEKPAEKKPTALAKQKKKKIKKDTPPKLKLNSMDALIAKALEGEAGLEKLDRLLKMKYEAEAREAKKMFHIHFSKMQADLPIIIKDKKVLNKAKDKILYFYSSLEQMVKQSKPIMSNHGFTYNWAEEFPEAKKKRIHFNITGYDHTESCYIDIPIMDANPFTNNIQQSGSASTYGRRYTMMNMLGLVCDEDDDGRASESKSDPPPTSDGMKNVTPDKVPPPAEKKEEEKMMLPKEITPTTMCTFGALKDAPKAYGKLPLDKLFALRRLAGNPEAIVGVINHVIGRHTDHYKILLKYGTKDMKEVVKANTGKDNELDCNSDERYKIMQHLRNISRKLEKEKKDEGS